MTSIKGFCIMVTSLSTSSSDSSPALLFMSISAFFKQMLENLRPTPLMDLIRQFTSSLVHVNISFLQADVGESSANSFDGCHSVHDFGFSINVCVHNTRDMLELVGNN